MLLVITGPMGLVFWLLPKFKKYYRYFKRRNVLGWTGILLGVLGLFLFRYTKFFMDDIGVTVHLNIPWFLDPRNLVSVYLYSGIGLFFGGVFVLANQSSGRWLIFIFGLISFVTTAFPCLVVADAMLDALRPVAHNMAHKAAEKITMFETLGHAFGPIGRYYIISLFLATPLIDIYFVLLLACASLSFHEESPFDEDAHYLESIYEEENVLRNAD